MKNEAGIVPRLVRLIADAFVQGDLFGAQVVEDAFK